MKTDELLVLALAGIAAYLIVKSARAVVGTGAALPSSTQEIRDIDGSAFDNGWRYFTDGTAIDDGGCYWHNGVKVWCP